MNHLEEAFKFLSWADPNKVTDINWRIGLAKAHALIAIAEQLEKIFELATLTLDAQGILIMPEVRQGHEYGCSDGKQEGTIDE